MTHLTDRLLGAGVIVLGPVRPDGTVTLVTNDDAIWLLQGRTWLRVNGFREANPRRGAVCNGYERGEYRQALWFLDHDDIRIWLHMPGPNGGTHTITGDIQLAKGLHPDDAIARADAER